MSLLVPILKGLVAAVFLVAAIQKLTGSVAQSWERWGFSHRAMHATAGAEIAGLVLYLWPRLEAIGAAALALVLVGALVTLARHREEAAHMAVPALTLALLLLQMYLS